MGSEMCIRDRHFKIIVRKFSILDDDTFPLQILHRKYLLTAMMIDDYSLSNFGYNLIEPRLSSWMGATEFLVHGVRGDIF